MKNKILNFDQFSSIYESEFYIKESESSGSKIDIGLDDLAVSSEQIADVMAELDPKAIKESGTGISAYGSIKPGEKGDRVKWLQGILGFEGKDVDGDFGPKTIKAVKDFQKNNKLTVDGKVGVQTLQKMVDVLKVPTEKQSEINKLLEDLRAKMPPELLALYEVYIVNTDKSGNNKKIILIPKKGAQEKVQAARESGMAEGLKLLLEGVKYAGKAIIWTGAAIVLVTLETANAMISGITAISKMVLGGAAYVAGVAVQGLMEFGKWIASVGEKAWEGLKDASTEIWKGVCDAVTLLGKASLKIVYGFIQGAQAVAYTLAGVALTIFQAAANTFDAAVKGVISAAKEVKTFVVNAVKAIGDGITKVKETLKAGFQYAVDVTKKALQGAIQGVKNFGKSVVAATERAYSGAVSWLSSMYEKGKKFFESTMYEVYGSEFLNENRHLIEFGELEFSLLSDDLDWRL